MAIIVAYVDIFGTLRDRVLGGQLRAPPRLAFACERIGRIIIPQRALLELL